MGKQRPEYSLYTYHNVSRRQLFRLRKTGNVEVNTIDKLCHILDCDISDVMEHIPDENVF